MLPLLAFDADVPPATATAPADASSIVAPPIVAPPIPTIDDAPIPAPTHHTRAALHVVWDLGPELVRVAPSFQGATVETPLRTVHNAELPSVGSLWMTRAAFDTQVYTDKLYFPLIGFAGAMATGESSRVVTSVDGSLAAMRPWTTLTATFLGPGIGATFPMRRWSAAASVRLAMTLTAMHYEVAAGAHAVDDAAVAVTGGVLGDAELCRRIDPSERVCVFVAPRLYDGAPLSGFAFGLRWRIGT